MGYGIELPADLQKDVKRIADALEKQNAIAALVADYLLQDAASDTPRDSRLTAANTRKALADLTNVNPKKTP